MRFPSDRDFAELQKDAEQRRLMRGGRGGLAFFRAVLFVFLAIGVIFLVSTGWDTFRGHGPQAMTTNHQRAIVFLLLWNLLVLSMVRLVSTQMAGIKREEEAEHGVGK